MARRVLIQTRDLFFRAKLLGAVRAAGGEVTNDEGACDLVVLELGASGADERMRELVERGIQVLAFGSHVNAGELRAARDVGAVAVPNSQVEQALLRALTGEKEGTP